MRTSLIMTTSFAAILAGAPAWAKLPPPPPDKAAAAAAAKEKAAHGEKVAAFKLCKAQDKLASQYLKSDKGSGRQPTQTPPCSDPGPFVPSASAPATAAPAAGATAATPAAATAATAAAAPQAQAQADTPVKK
ncbi:MAG TPA: hypothetical protein VIM12_03525 [Noviherbaspirillum sp.]|jgi:hypothetical protein|uniref:hypothetical protein n=1 Tax=Noviherbaspirillum sp. TaxID=1926288 RepID=UPI002F932B71